MKKIMFNDKFGLTQAVLEGRKTMTRRVVSPRDSKRAKAIASPLKCYFYIDVLCSRYQIGEVVAIAQCYYDVYGYETCISERGEKDSGIFNKMFVRADSMPHHIKITNIRVEHLQDISDEDCLREGVRLWEDADPEYKSNPLGKLYEIVGMWDGYKSPREAFAALIDKVSGKGTWDSNPLVWVYEFELVD